MAPRAKYYVVWKGRKPGIYESWAECEAQVKGFTGASFKAFPTRALAEKALHGGYPRVRREPDPGMLWEFSPNPPVTSSIAVDAACSGSPGPVEFRGVHTRTGREIFRKGPFPNGTNNVGEFLAVVYALTWLKEMNNGSPVYTDSITARAWVRAKKCKTRLRRDRTNAVLFDLIARAEAWLAENECPNPVLKWETKDWGEIPADFNRK